MLVRDIVIREGKDILNSPDCLVQLSKEKADEVISYCCYVISSDIEDDCKEIFLNILYLISFRPDMTIEECWEIYWILSRTMFLHHRLHLNNIAKDQFLKKTMTLPKEWNKTASISTLYRSIIDALNEVIDYSKFVIKTYSERNSNLIVITTNQFLTIQHAPTQRVLDYAYVIQEKIGKKVVIINTGGTHYHTRSDRSSFEFQFIDEYCDKKQIYYKNVAFDFVQVPQLMPDVMVLQCMINFIYSLNPLLVFNIGASDILTDLCTPFVTTASLPCSCDYPVTCSKYMIVGRKINTEETEYINRLSYQNVIEANYNYIYRDSELVYNIKDYNIPDNKFLIAVVGYRLEKEMNKDFIELIDKILNMKISDRLKEECAEPYIVIIGNFDNPDKLLSSVSEVNREKIKFIGQINDAGEFVSLCKLYINPDRSGGGRSSFESLHHGIPVVTLNKGDVYYTCGDSFAVEDWEKYYEIVNKYYIDLEFYNLQREKAFKRADELENLQMTLEEIIGKITTSSEKEDL